MRFSCEVIDSFASSGFLKFTMSIQFILGLASLISVLITQRLILKTAIVDRAFKVSFFYFSRFYLIFSSLVAQKEL